MTIEYKDSKRIVALSTDVVETPTYSDDFSGTDDWADQGSGVGVNTTTDRLEFSSWTDNTTNNSSTLDLGSALSDTKWTIRFRLHWTGFSNTTDWTAPAIGMFSADSSTGGNSAQDMLIYWSIANGSEKRVYLSSADNSTISGTDHNLNLSWVLDTTYYVQLQRDGSNFSATVWTGSYNGTEVASGTDTIGGTVSGLQYFGVKSPVTNRGGSFTGWLDDLKIWNGITSLTSKPTNVQDNSLFIEKDTARRYWFTSEVNNLTFEDDFSGADNWSKSPSDSQFAVDTTNDRLEFLDDVNSTGDRTWYDLGTDVSTTKWVLRFKFRFTTLSNGSIQYYEFDAGLSDTTVDNNTNQNFIGVRVLPNDDIDLWRPRVCDGSSSPRTGSTANLTQVFATNTDYFVEIKRTSASNWAISLSTTNAYDGDLQNNSYTDASGATGLRYLKIGDAVTNTGTGFSMEGYVDDVEFYNNATTPTTPATWTKQNPELPTVSGLYVHYDATDVDSITKDSNNRISQWNDKSGGARHLTQATSGNQPLWIASDEAGNPVIDFSDDRYMSDTWSAQSLPNTIFIVARLPVATGTRTNIISGASGNAQSVFGDGSNTWKYAAGSAQGGTKTGIEDTWQYIYALYGDDYTFEIGGELISGASCGSDTWIGMEVGASSGAQFGNMKIGEIIGYNVAVKGDDKTAIINYLKEKWERT